MTKFIQGRPIGQEASLPLFSGRRKSNHTRPRPPEIDVNGPGRLRVAHVMALLGISHSTLYARIRTGVVPKADGRDGSTPFWYTSSIRPLVSGATQDSASA